MVAILTLFVGLVAGLQSVELAVAGSVAVVELRLGERVVGRATGPAWVARCDLGPDLHPAELVAVGLDQDGREVARDAVILNLPDRRAEAVLAPVVDDAGRLVAATVRWSSPELGDPRSLTAEVDGRVVEVSVDRRVDLRPFADGRVHVLAVALTFAEGVNLRQELVFGSGHAGELAYDLSAVPVRWTGPGELDPGRLTGAFAAAGAPAEMAAVETGSARLVVVRDDGVDDALDRLLAERERAGRRQRSATAAADLLGEEVAVQVMAPLTVQPDAAGRSSLLFPISGDLQAHRQGLLRLVADARYAPRAFGLRRLADAVAVAGMRAAAGNHRRAVVVLLGAATDDSSRHRAAEVRGYLSELRVPLAVWDVTGEATAAAGWGEVADVSSWPALAARVAELGRDLERQRIVWLRGRHLPHRIALHHPVPDLTLID